MIRHCAVLAVLCGLALAAGLTAVTVHGRLDSSPVYSVAQVQARLARHADAWNGRTIRVRGVVSGCPYRFPGPCASWQPELRDPAPRSSEADAGLLLVPIPARANALTALLRRIPWVRALMRSPQVVQWGVAATYQVQLQVMAGSHCGGGPCYTVLLLDAAP
jgi:hypothetical protein